MELVPTFLKELLLGLAVAAPVGPIGMLCIQRTLAGGAAIGFASGLGGFGLAALIGAVR